MILRGLLAYRAALGGLGITVGFQWLNGSFMQEVETTEDRPPNDIDVVTYIAIPEGATQASLMEQAPYLFRSKLSKPIYRVDAYVLPFLNRQVSGKQIERVTYWYSMWSHTRETNTWKGFVLTALSPDDDAVASALLNQQDLEGADDDQPE